MGEENVYLIPAKKKSRRKKIPELSFDSPHAAGELKGPQTKFCSDTRRSFFYTHSRRLSIGLKRKLIF